VEKEKTIGLAFSLLLGIGAVLILAFLVWINARQIYTHLAIYHNSAGVKSWMWVNVVVGSLSIVTIAGISIYQQFHLDRMAAWLIFGIFLLNVAMRIVEDLLFFGSSKGGWVG
jgi:hypothetical protein